MTPEYEEFHQDERELIEELKSAIKQQVPLIERCFQIHAQRITPDMEPFHVRLEQCFKDMRANIQAKYGSVVSFELFYCFLRFIFFLLNQSEEEMKLLKLPHTGTLRRQTSISVNGSQYSMNERNSVNSLTPSE